MSNKRPHIEPNNHVELSSVDNWTPIGDGFEYRQSDRTMLVRRRGGFATAMISDDGHPGFVSETTQGDIVMAKWQENDSVLCHNIRSLTFITDQSGDEIKLPDLFAQWVSLTTMLPDGAVKHIDRAAPSGTAFRLPFKRA